MDPISAFNAMMDAREYGRMDEAQEYADALTQWINRGGFVPMLRVSSDDRTQYLISDDLARKFYLAVCDEITKAEPRVDQDWQP